MRSRRGREALRRRAGRGYWRWFRPVKPREGFEGVGYHGWGTFPVHKNVPFFVERKVPMGAGNPPVKRDVGEQGPQVVPVLRAQSYPLISGQPSSNERVKLSKGRSPIGSRPR